MSDIYLDAKGCATAVVLASILLFLFGIAVHNHVIDPEPERESFRE